MKDGEATKYTFGSAVGDKVVITAKANPAFEEDVDVMLTFGDGSWDDMEASSDYFHFAKGSTSASITLTRKAVSRRFREAEYEITVHPNGSQKGIRQILLDYLKDCHFCRERELLLCHLL